MGRGECDYKTSLDDSTFNLVLQQGKVYLSIVIYVLQPEFIQAFQA